MQHTLVALEVVRDAHDAEELGDEIVRQKFAPAIDKKKRRRLNKKKGTAPITQQT